MKGWIMHQRRGNGGGEIRIRAHGTIPRKLNGRRMGHGNLHRRHPDIHMSRHHLYMAVHDQRNPNAAPTWTNHPPFEYGER